MKINRNTNFQRWISALTIEGFFTFINRPCFHCPIVADCSIMVFGTEHCKDRFKVWDNKEESDA